ncbi:MAG: hypothetical protein AB1578_15610 [Thermodesulfobacteriota bacterium]
MGGLGVLRVAALAASLLAAGVAQAGKPPPVTGTAITGKVTDAVTGSWTVPIPAVPGTGPAGEGAGGAAGSAWPHPRTFRPGEGKEVVGRRGGD